MSSILPAEKQTMMERSYNTSLNKHHSSNGDGKGDGGAIRSLVCSYCKQGTYQLNVNYLHSFTSIHHQRCHVLSCYTHQYVGQEIKAECLIYHFIFIYSAPVGAQMGKIVGR